MSRNRYCERIGREHKSNHGNSYLFLYLLVVMIPHFSKTLIINKMLEIFSSVYEMEIDVNQNLTGTVMYVVDLRRAIYYQKCHDPDCRGKEHLICHQFINVHILPIS